ncbi:DUF805 domain-containing protein [Candidatus Wolfebacteria bacterium]|nr:DUF805 domain-containing protein [Candidatus Wolfebacteria bacterium]
MARIKSFWRYLKKVTEGRVGRKHYFFGLLLFIVSFFVIIVLLSLFVATLPSPNSFFAVIYVAAFMIISFCIIILYILYIFSLHIRRLHDQGNSGWWCIPPITPYVMLFGFFKKGEQKTNKYGDIPSGSFLRTILNLRVNSNI